MEDLKPPYIFCCPSPPFISIYRALLHPVGGGGGDPRHARYFFFFPPPLSLSLSPSLRNKNVRLCVWRVIRLPLWRDLRKQKSDRSLCSSRINRILPLDTIRAIFLIFIVIADVGKVWSITNVESRSNGTGRKKRKRRWMERESLNDGNLAIWKLNPFKGGVERGAIRF